MKLNKVTNASQLSRPILLATALLLLVGPLSSKAAPPAPAAESPLGRQPQLALQTAQLSPAQPREASMGAGAGVATNQQQPQQPTLLSVSQQQQAQAQAQQTQNQLNQKLQAHLSAMHAQAQRQLGQLNGLVMNGASQLVASAQPLAAQAVNLTAATAGKTYGNVLEALANVGKVIQSQILANPNGVQIVGQESGNNKKNEYQSIVVNDNQPLVTGSQQATSSSSSNSPFQTSQNSTNYREQGEQLRQEIMRRAGQLQQVVASSMDVLKNNGDLIVRRLLEQLNHRLDQAKSKADKIISEPANNEVAIKALGTINMGLNNVNNIITNIVNRLDLGSKDGVQGQHQLAQRVSGSSESSPFLDPNRLKINLQQLGQQFHSALNAGQQQLVSGSKWPVQGSQSSVMTNAQQPNQPARAN